MELKVSPFARNIYVQIEKTGISGFNPLRARIAGIEHALAELAGHIIVFAEDLVISRKTGEDYIGRILADSQSGDTLTLAEAKNKSGLSRRILVPLLEYMDSLGLTERKGPDRTILRTGSTGQESL